MEGCVQPGIISRKGPFIGMGDVRGRVRRSDDASRCWGRSYDCKSSRWTRRERKLGCARQVRTIFLHNSMSAEADS